MRYLQLEVAGTPVPQGSMSAFAVKDSQGNATGKVNVTSGNKRLPAWRKQISKAAKQAGTLLPGPVSVTVDFYLPRPKSHYRTGKFAHLLKDNAPVFHTVKPDVDKLVRAVLDGLTTGEAYTDDNQVISELGRKHWCEPGQERAEITALVIAPAPQNSPHP